MFTSTTYDFGYSWWVSYGLLVPFAAALAVAAVALWRGWRRWVVAVAALVMAWSAAGVLAVTVFFGLNRPLELPTSSFLASGHRVLDVGAGSGRAAVGVLLARPQATVTGLDIYRGYWGIDDNTPERFMHNARVAGAGGRARAVSADMREMPFGNGEFDAVISSYAIDHLRRTDVPRALAEVSRVLVPGGEFLLLVVNVDWKTRLFSPHAIAHHAPADPERWRGLLRDAGFEIREQGTSTGTLYFLAIKRTSGSA